MSGGFGWHSNQKPIVQPTQRYDYSDAKDQYQQKSVKVINPPTQHVNTLAPSIHLQKNISSPIKQNLPKKIYNAKQKLKSSAKNIIIVSLDLTGSLSSWCDEIRKRLSTLFIEAQQYLGPDLQVLFVGHGDVLTDCKEGKGEPLQVTEFGSGPELEHYLECLSTEGIWGGGNRAESSELIAFSIYENVDLSSAENVFMIFITDEPGRDVINDYYSAKYCNTISNNFLTINMFQELKNKKYNIFNVFCETPTGLSSLGYKKWWQDILGEENVLSLNDKRRVVDVILGIIASVSNQDELFDKLLLEKQKGTTHQKDNISTVKGSLAILRSKLQTSNQVKQADLLDD